MDRCLIAGLGNPGAKYENTRHNAGFMVVDLFAARIGARFSLKEGTHLLATGQVGSKRVILVKPQLYMNRSGGSIAPLVRYYRIELNSCLVVHDDIDMDLGSLKLVRGGGSGGHNGIRSIIEKLGSRDFPRLKLGIGRPAGRMPVDRYVLSRFDAAEQQVMDRVVETAADAVECFLTRGIDEAMNRFNGMDLR